MTADLDHLRDHVDLILAVIGVCARFTTSGDGEATALRAAAENCQEDIVVRQLANPGLTSSIAFERQLGPAAARDTAPIERHSAVRQHRDLSEANEAAPPNKLAMPIG
jgi:hypothetical protein